MAIKVSVQTASIRSSIVCASQSFPGGGGSPGRRMRTVMSRLRGRLLTGVLYQKEREPPALEPPLAAR